MLKTLTIATALLAFSSAALAESPENYIKYRQAMMKAIGGHMGASTQIVRGKITAPGDLAMHADALAALNADLARLFPEGSDFGETQAKFVITDTENGFIFEKEGQRGVNFDFSEWGETGIHWLRLEIPYPKTGGPGGDFHIVGMYTPISDNKVAVFHWRVRKVEGWQRDAWRFLYKNRLEARHHHVLEQDRVMLEDIQIDPRGREILYQHDLGLVRLRRRLKTLATEQLEAEARAAAGE